MSSLKKKIQLSPFWPILRDIRDRKAMATWESRGKPLPPPHPVKQKRIIDTAEEYELKVLVETGTYLGDMIEKVGDKFGEVYSIEISEELHAKACKKFRGKGHINLLLGDSGEILESLLPKLQKPTLFWLDAHYSSGITGRGKEDCPIYGELRSIFKLDVPYVILIDDARDFGRDPGYPSIDELEKFVQENEPSLSLKVENDCIYFLPT